MLSFGRTHVSPKVVFAGGEAAGVDVGATGVGVGVEGTGVLGMLSTLI